MNSLSNFFKQKERICKCGHNKKEHYRQPKTTWSILSECNRCKCSSFMNRKRPDVGDKFSMVYGFAIIGFGIFCIIIIQPSFNVDSTIKFPTKTLGIIVDCLILLGITYMTGLITPYFTTKRRKTYPIEDNDEQK